MGRLLYFRDGKLLKEKASTYELLNETRQNKGGKTYNLFDSESRREQNLAFVAETLDGMRETIQGLCPEGGADRVDQHFEDTIKNISAIRIDQKDRNEFPMKLIFDEFTHGGSIPFESKLRDGVTRSVAADGIMMLMPELKEESKEPQKVSARHTLVHEMLHAMSNRTEMENGRPTYVPGMQIHGSDNIFDDLNEGINEYYTQKVMRRMYPDAPIEDRYKARTSVIDAFMQHMDEGAQERLFEAYVSGEFGSVLTEQFENIKTKDGESLRQRLEKLRQGQFRVDASLSEKNMKNAQMLIDGFKDFKFNLGPSKIDE